MNTPTPKPKSPLLLPARNDTSEEAEAVRALYKDAFFDMFDNLDLTRDDFTLIQWFIMFVSSHHPVNHLKAMLLPDVIDKVQKALSEAIAQNDSLAQFRARCMSTLMADLRENGPLANSPLRKYCKD